MDEDLRILVLRSRLAMRAQHRALHVRLYAERRIGQFMELIERAGIANQKRDSRNPICPG